MTGSFVPADLRCLPTVSRSPILAATDAANDRRLPDAMNRFEPENVNHDTAGKLLS